jgi:hypothetical protein
MIGLIGMILLIFGFTFYLINIINNKFYKNKFK